MKNVFNVYHFFFHLVSSVMPKAVVKVKTDTPVRGKPVAIPWKTECTQRFVSFLYPDHI